MKTPQRLGWRPAIRSGVGLLALGAWIAAQAAAPVVSNVRVSQRAGTGLVDIYYDVADADGDPLYVTVEVSFNSGASYRNLPKTFSGEGYGSAVTPGNDLHIIWDAGADLDPLLYRHARVKVVADDGFAHVPADMAYVPAGYFAMGDAYHEGNSSERPMHEVYVSSFSIDKFEVTQRLWEQVHNWGTGHGYDFDEEAGGSGPDHPIIGVSWYDAVKWANARSESLGFQPAYYTDASRSTVYRKGYVDVPNDAVDWGADGFRLPTEAEWEKAARGGLEGHHFPWSSFGGDYSSHIDFSRANYGHSKEGTMPVGSYPANGYGLYDMAGNVWEWCWDWRGSNWYSQAGATGTDPRGPTSGSGRVFRGGGWSDGATYCRVASRSFSEPRNRFYNLGFRLVRGRL